uniref:Uncharacterized protein n=1 Tax=Canis lupus familiaris TaxID=9615 RepID=A0A8P0TUC7_CANLF
MEVKRKLVAILTSDKTDFEIKTVKRDKEGHYMIINRTIKQEDVTIVNFYASTMEASKYIKQLITNIKEVINNNTIIVGDIKTPLTWGSWVAQWLSICLRSLSQGPG